VGRLTVQSVVRAVKKAGGGEVVCRDREGRGGGIERGKRRRREEEGEE